MNIYILLEIKRRELCSKILLSAEAALKGNEVYLGKLTPFLLKNLFKPGIVHFKSITPGLSRLRQLEFFKNNQFITTSSDEEHGLINNDSSYKKYRYSNKSLSLVTKIFTWGNFDYLNLIKQYPKYKNKILKIGNPRVDFWRKDFKSYFRSLPNFKYKNYILLSANFEGFGHQKLNERLKFHERTGYFLRGVSRKNMIKRFKDSQALFKHYERSIKNLSKILNNKQIIIRPHPKDDSKLWKKKFEKFKNIKIIDEGDHSDWISNSKVVIHAGCTGGLEASLRGKKTISYYPLKVLHGHKFADSFSTMISSENKLIDEISKCYDFTKSEPYPTNKMINKRLFNYNGDRSYKRIVEIWSNLGKKITSKKNNIFFIKFVFFILNLKLKVFKIKTGNYKFEKFEKSEVESILSRLCNVDKKFKDIRVEFLKDDVIKFYKKT